MNQPNIENVCFILTWTRAYIEIVSCSNLAEWEGVKQRNMLKAVNGKGICLWLKITDIPNGFQLGLIAKYIVINGYTSITFVHVGHKPVKRVCRRFQVFVQQVYQE